MSCKYIYRFSRTILIAIFLVGSTLLPVLTYSPVSAATSTTDKKLTYKYDKLFNVGTPGGGSQVDSVTTDNSGNIYITGSLSGRVTLPGANGFSVNVPIKNISPNSSPTPMSIPQPKNIGPNSSFGPKNQIGPKADSLSGTTFVAKLDTNNNILWSKVISSNNLLIGNSVAIDSSGNVFVAGYFYGTVVFNPGDPVSSRTSINQDSFLVKYNSSGAYQSVKTFDASTGLAVTISTSVDSSGNVFVAGLYNGTVVFNPGDPGSSVTSGSGNDDGFLVKYNSSGVYQSVKIFDTSGVNGNANTLTMAIDSSENVYVAGQFSGTVLFNPGDPGSSVTSVSGDGFLVKYNSSGVYQSVNTFDASNNGYAGINSLAIDSSGNVYVAGYFNGTVVFNPGDPGSSISSSGYSVFLVKYDSSGVYQSVNTFDTSSGYASPTSLAIDSSGNVFVAGYFYGTVVFNPGDPVSSRTSINQDSFLVKYNSSGAYQSVKTFDASSGNTNTFTIAIDSSGNVYVAGQFSGTVVFNPGDPISSVTSSSNNGFLVKYNSSAVYSWAKTMQSNGNNVGQANSNSIATDSSGNKYVAGYFNGTVVFNPGDPSSSMTSSSNNGFLVKYNKDGIYQSVKIFDSSNGGYAATNSVSIDSNSNVYVAGYFNGTVVFNPGDPGSSVNSSSGYNKGFLVKYNSSGVYQSVKTFDADTNGGNAYIYSLAVDSICNVYVAGQFTGTVVFNPGDPGSSVTSNNGDSFLVKYNSSGVYQSVKTFDTSSGNANTNSMAVDSSGNVFVAGIFYGTTVFNPGDLGSSVTGNSGDSFLVKYNSNGVYQSVKTIHNTSNGDMAIDSIAFDSSGNIFAAGFLSGTAIFSPGDPVSSVTTSNYASYLVKYNKDGSYAWVKTFGLGETGSNSGNYTIAIDSNNDIYLGGSYTGTIYFDGPGGNIGAPNTVLGTNNAYLVKLDPNGKYLTSSVFDSSDPAGANSYIYGIALRNNEVSVVGSFYGAVQFNPGDSTTKAAFNQGNGFMVTYDLTSTLLPINTPNTGFAKEVNNKLSITEDVVIIGSVITLCLVARKYKAYK